MEWDSAFIEKTYQDRIRERELAPMMARREDNLFKLTSKSLYGEKVHYALELIQNAEDAGASTITFIFDKESHANVKCIFSVPFSYRVNLTIPFGKKLFTVILAGAAIAKSQEQIPYLFSTLRDSGMISVYCWQTYCIYLYLLQQIE